MAGQKRMLDDGRLYGSCRLVETEGDLRRENCRFDRGPKAFSMPSARRSVSRFSDAIGNHLTTIRINARDADDSGPNGETKWLGDCGGAYLHANVV